MLVDSHPSALTIIGSGLAGYMLAKEFRKLDPVAPLVIITADDGAFYSKPLLSTALTQQKTPDHLQVSSAAEMAAELCATIHTHTMVTAIARAERRLSFISHPPTTTPSTATTPAAITSELSFSRLVLACGADKIQPLVCGDGVEEIYSVNDLVDYRHFRQWLIGKKRLAVLGAGLVSCEFANDLLNVHYQLEIIAPENHPLAYLVPAPIGCLLQNELVKKGAHWHLGHLVTEVNKAAPRGEGEGRYQVKLSNGVELEVDGVFSAVGLRPRIGLAKSAGLVTQRGIVVNRWLQTNDPHIFALGDCAQVDGLVKLYVAPLLQCARALAKILTGGHEPVHYPVMPVVIKTPACPVVSVPPPTHVIGEWHFEGEGSHLRALFFDHDGQLQGFALVGDKVRDKLTLSKELPLVFAE